MNTNTQKCALHIVVGFFLSFCLVLFCFFFLFFCYLLIVDVQDSFQRQFFKVQFVTFIKVCAHSLRVAIHHHGLLSKLTKCADTGDSTPIKLYTAPCKDRKIKKGGKESTKLQYKNKQ